MWNTKIIDKKNKSKESNKNKPRSASAIFWWWFFFEFYFLGIFEYFRSCNFLYEFRNKIIIFSKIEFFIKDTIFSNSKIGVSKRFENPQKQISKSKNHFRKFSTIAKTHTSRNFCQKIWISKIPKKFEIKNKFRKIRKTKPGLCLDWIFQFFLI